MRFLFLLAAVALAPAAAAQTTYTVKASGVSEKVQADKIQILLIGDLFEVRADDTVIEGRGPVTVASEGEPTARGASVSHTTTIEIDDDGTVTQTSSTTRTETRDETTKTTTTTTTTTTTSSGETSTTTEETSSETTVR